MNKLLVNSPENTHLRLNWTYHTVWLTSYLIGLGFTKQVPT